MAVALVPVELLSTRLLSSSPSWCAGSSPSSVTVGATAGGRCRQPCERQRPAAVASSVLCASAAIWAAAAHRRGCAAIARRASFEEPPEPSSLSLSKLRNAPACTLHAAGGAGGGGARTVNDRGRAWSGRRRVTAAVLTVVVSAASWCSDLSSAGAASSIDLIIAESRRKATEPGGLFNAYTYKTPTGNYNFTDLQSYLPTLYLARRSFETTLVQLENPKVNVSDHVTYEQLRQQNRLAPAKFLRKESFRTKLWLQDRAGNQEFAEREYERLKRALDEEDTQALVLARTEGLIEPAAVRVTKRNVQSLIDSLDDLLELVPAEERVTAKLVADTKKIQVLKLPLVKRAKVEEVYGTGGDNTVFMATTAEAQAVSSQDTNTTNSTDGALRLA